MRLRDLSEGCFEVPAELHDIEVSGLACDSREVKPGYLFVAVMGPKTDGHRFLRQAEQAGAVAVVGETSWFTQRGQSDPSLVPVKIPFLCAQDSHGALGRMASSFFGRKADALEIVGVTGTKGKTTTAWILDGIFRGAGKVSGLLGTVHHRIGDRTYPSSNTTPSCIEIHRLLHELACQGGTHAAMEVSSHGISQRRTAGIKFRCGIFTNVAPEHLDYHETYENYVETKVRFFVDLDPAAHAVLPREEPTSRDIAARTPARVAWYGTEPQDGVEKVRMGPDGTSFRWKGQAVRSSLWGHHNLLNLLGAMTAAECLGFSSQEIAGTIEGVTAPPGRLEDVSHGGEFHVFVDYAHTDGSLEAVLRALRDITEGRLITVFGCGGERDRGKRPRMGRVAERWSNRVIVTSDNPRSEDPKKIMDEIAAGLERPQEAVFERDRREAIGLGIRLARKGDTVLIAGKGHETYQESGGQRIHFDDREVAREILRGRGEPWNR